MRPIKRFGQRFFGGAQVGVAQLGVQPWQEGVYLPEGKRWISRQRVLPELPNRRLHDGTLVKPAGKTIRYRQIVDEDDYQLPPHPLARARPRGFTGWKLAFWLGATFFGTLFGLPLGGDFYPPTVSNTLTTLPFIDASDPKWGIAGNGTTDDTTAIQNMLTTNGGATYYFSFKTYLISAPLLYAEGTWIVGAGTNSRKITTGTTFKIASGGAAGTWAGQGIFTTNIYASNTAGARNLEICGFRDFLMDGNNQTYGNGIVLCGIQQPYVWNLRWENYKGSQGMGQRGSGNSKASGQGFMVCLTVYTINGTAFGGINPNDPFIVNIRQTAATAGNNATPLIYTDDDGTSSITDGFVQWVQPEGAGSSSTPLTNGGGQAQGVIDVNHSGGWHFDFVHTNGPAGNALVLRNCFSTHLYNSWLDGWGTAATNGSTFDCLSTTMTTGGGSGIGPFNIWGNVFRWRDEQTNGGGTVTYRALACNASGTNSIVNFFGNSGFIQSNLATGTMRLFNLGGTGTTSTLNVNGNTFLDADATSLDDVEIFAAIASGWSVVNDASNNWDLAAAAPTTGVWPVGYIKRNSAPAVGSAYTFVCTVGGTSGTWASGTLIQTQSGTFGATTNTQNPAAAVNVTGAAFTINANEVWTCTFWINATSTGTGGQTYKFTLPTGATATALYQGPNSSVSNWRGSSTGGGTSATFSSTAAIANFPILINIRVTAAATSGTVQLQIANITNGESQSVNDGTFLATRIT